MSNATVSDEGIAPNAKRLLWAGFLAILAAGIGFETFDVGDVRGSRADVNA